MTLTDDQAKQILIESLSRGLYESPGNVPPEDSAQRMQDALTLVSGAQRAAAAGNKSDNVMAILFLAEVDQSPPAKAPPAPTPEPEPEVGQKAAQSNSGFDLSTVSDAVLENLIIGLDKYVVTPAVEQQEAAFFAEKERRANAIKEEGISSIANDDKQISSQQTISETTERENTGEDAGAFARVQTPETSPEGRKTKTKTIEQDAERDKVINELNLSILENYGIKFVEVEKIDTAKLKLMIANPDGPPAVENKEEEMKIETKLGNFGGKEAMAGIDMAAQAPIQIISKQDIGLDEASAKEIVSPDREGLEAQITGPILKAFRRGRLEIPSIGDNELRLMIANPTGQVTLDELNAAKAADGGMAPAQKEELISNASDMQVTKEILGEPIVQSFLDPQQMLREAESAAEKEIQISLPNQIDVENINTVVEGETTIAQAAQQAVAQQPKAVSRAMEVIGKENLPIPDELTSDSPRLPNDVSKCSKDEIYSYHARFHAAEVRANWLISEEEDKLGDATKLKKGREVEVYSAIPPIIEGVKTTNDYRDKVTAADADVIELSNKEYEIFKVVKKFKTLRDCYHLDVERLSRQMSKWHDEYKGAS